MRVPLLALLVVLGASACSGSSANPAVDRAGAASTTAASAAAGPIGPVLPHPLVAELIALADLPEGWNLVQAGGDASPDAQDADQSLTCSGTHPAATQTEKATIDFSLNEETLQDELESYPSVAAATTAFDALSAYLKTCTSADVGAATLKIAGLAVPSTGDEASGLQASGTINTTPIAVDLAYARKGSVIVTVNHLDAQPIDSSVTFSVLALATSRVS